MRDSPESTDKRLSSVSLHRFFETYLTLGRLRAQRKALSPVIAAFLMVAVALAASVTAQVWSTHLFGALTGIGGADWTSKKKTTETTSMYTSVTVTSTYPSVTTSQTVTTSTYPSTTTSTTSTTSTSAGPSYTVHIDSDGKIKARNDVTGTIDYTGTDAAAVLQRSIDALSRTGGLITLKSGTYIWQSTPALPKDLPNWLKIVGEARVTIQLTANGPRAFDFGKTADYDTFRYIWLESLTIDCNNVGGRHHVVLGTYRDGDIQTRINLQDITIRNIVTKNVPVDSTMSNHRLNVFLVVAHPNTGEAQTNIKNILVENCDFRGGNQGVVIGAHGPDAVGINVYVDQIYIHNCRHSLLAPQTQYFYSANFHVCSRGFGGYVHIADCYGEYSGDVGVEVNAVNALVENTVITDAGQVAFYHTNYNIPQNPGEQSIILRNCEARRLNLPSNLPGTPFAVNVNLGVPTATVIRNNCNF